MIEKIEQARKLKGYTKKTLCRLANISDDTYKRLLEGNNSNTNTIVSVCKVLDIKKICIDIF